MKFTKPALIVVLLSVVLFSSCSVTVKQVGKVNMISTLNIDSETEYVLISSYAGGSKQQLKKSRALTIESAIDNTVRMVPGGEYLKNVKIYLVNHKYYAVEGDVWGIAGVEKTFKGFKVGDKVMWKKWGKFKNGVIISLKDDKTCIVQDDEGNAKEFEYDDIVKVQ